MFRKSNKDKGEKIFRYSIRKYHFGAASVAVAALMFFANGVQAQAPAVSSATASDVVAGSAGNSDGEEPEKVSQTEPSAELQSTGESNSPETKAEDASKGQETADLAPTKPETKPVAQETSQGGAVKEQDQPTSATKTTEAKSLQGNLQALLEKLTLSSMKALHDEVESRLAAAKAVLDDPNATQAQVDEQVKLMEDLIRRVNQALTPSLDTPTILENAGLTSTGLASTGLTAPEGAILTPKTAVTKALEESHVSSTNGEVSTPSTELSKPEVSDNQNKEKLKTLSKDLSAYLIQANEITRPETKKLLEGVEEVVKSIEASVLQPQLTPAEIEELLKKGKQAERKLALALTRENSGKRDLLNGKPMKQGSDLRATPEALNTKRAYIVRKGDGIDLPAETYLYALKRRQTDKPTDGNLVPVSDAVAEAKVTVENLGNGNFKWNLTFNSKQKTHQNAFYWFTLPTGHTITQTLAVTRTNGEHTKSHVVGRNSFNTEWGESIKNTLRGNLATYGPASGKDGGFNTNFSSIHDVTNTDFIARSASAQRTGAQPIDSRGSSGYYYLGPLQDRFRRWPSSTAVSQEFYKKSEKIIDGLKQNAGLLYHFTLNDGKVQISYITHTDTPYAPIYYGAGMRSLEHNEALMYFMARGLQEKPNAPTVTSSDEGTVTVTPYQNSDSDQNKNVDKVELSYTNARGESKTATLKRDAGNGTWSSNDTGIKVSGNSFIVKQGTAKVGTPVKAKSYYGNSDPSDERQVPVPTVTPQNTKYRASAKDPKQVVDHNGDPVAEKSINTTNLPSGTTYSWKSGSKPDTSKPGDRPGTVIVTYPDKTTTEVSVSVTVTPQNTKYRASAKDPKQVVDHNGDPVAEKSINTTNLPSGTTYSWKSGSKPDTSKPGDRPGTVIVTYPDKTTTEVSVSVTVTPQNTKYRASAKDPKQVVDHNGDPVAEKSINTTNLPSGTTYSWKSGSKPDTSKPGDRPGTVIVTYPDKTTTEVSVSVTVTPQNTKYRASAKDPKQVVDHNGDPVAEKSINTTNLPSGTTYSWKSGSKPDTSKPGDRPGTVIVTYPDKTTTEVSVSVTVTPQNTKYRASAKDPKQVVDHNGDPVAEKSINTTNLPSGTTYSWKENGKPDTSKPGDRPGTVIVTYPDKTTTEVSVSVTVTPQNTKYRASAKDPKQVVDHNGDPVAEKSINTTNLPSGTTYSWKSGSKPDTSKPGDRPGTVIVTYPDKTTTEVSVSVTVTPQNTKYRASAKDPKQVVDHNGDPVAEKSINTTNLPSGTTYSWKSGSKPDTSKPGDRPGTVIVTYPDKTTTEVSVSVTVTPQNTKYRASAKDPKQVVDHNGDPVAEKSINTTNLPSGTTYSWKSGSKPDTSKPGDRPGTVIVTYPDKTTTEVSVSVTVTPQNTKYRASAKDPKQVVDHNGDPVAEKSINTTNLPSGTTYSWKENGKPDTSKPGDRPGTVIVTYPDKTTTEVSVSVTVTPQNTKYQASAKDPKQVVDHNGDPVAEKSIDTTNLPSGTTYSWKENGKPDTSKPGDRPGTVIVTYPDKTTTEVSVSVTVTPQNTKYQASAKDPKQVVDHNGDPVAEKSIDTTNLPSGTTYSWKSGSKPDTSKPGDRPGTVIVTYPDKTTTEVSVSVTVTPQNTKYRASAKDPKQVVDHNGDPVAEKSINTTNLPSGTTYSWKSGSKPDTSKPGDRPGTVIVTYPDKTTTEVSVSVTVTPQNTKYRASAKDPKQVVDHNGDPVAEKSIDTTNLPSGTTYSWKENGKPDTSKPGDRPGTVIVTYPDKTTTEVSVSVTVTPQNTKYQASAKDPKQVVDHNGDPVAEKSIDTTNLPSGTTYSWKENGKPDTSKPGDRPGTVIVTYPDKTTTEVSVSVTVTPQNTKYQASAKDPKQVVDHNGDPVAEKSIDTTNLPSGTTYSWKENGKPDTSKPGDRPGTVIVTYPDKTTTEVSVSVTVTPQNTKYQASAKDPKQVVDHNGDPVAEKSIDTTNLPSGTTYSWKENGKPDTSKPGDRPGTVIVTYPDKTTTEVSVSVTVTPQNTKYQASAKDPKQVVDHNGDPVAEKSIDTTNLPSGTTYSWKENGKPDTSKPGDRPGTVIVTYPDGTTDEVNVTVKVTGQDFTPVKPTEKVPVKDKDHLTQEEQKQVEDKVQAKNPDKTVTVGEDGTATVTDPTTGISHTIPGSDLVNQVPKNGDNSSNDEKSDQRMVPRPNPTPTPRPDDSANTNNGGTTAPADSNRNSVTPDNSDNTLAPSVTTDDSSNATSSSTVGQAQASAPAHSGDSTDQATAPSAQQRGTGNATEAESSRGLSGSSVTAPARSRRSVAFAGGAQSSQEKQVDKSVLRDLIQDLETRLKDLDGIDQSVIDAAKVILGEGQEALRNADLTEAGLREITAKVKEALESLKGKQTTKDEEMKETRKEQGHLPYGTMIGSLLALLGLLLFLIARRKKESELKKLTKELTKVLQDGDLTNVDVKVLDQAREALAQAVAFLANEKESDHTEDELIEKLKAILAQLR
ncbi:Rib/alpha-like domain-containing protein [Streptococcus mitis]|uniref:Rib/alpha-like domain-containing protein n=1 Tax=Streptococcus mitis TaxID=28037 RepID=UPI00398BE691